MEKTINKSIAKGTVKAPPSKSMAHRYIICAALTKGESVISNVDFSEDIKPPSTVLRHSEPMSEWTVQMFLSTEKTVFYINT